MIYLDPMDAIKELRGERCFCGHSKIRGRSFCMSCWTRLNASTSKKLWSHIDAGYLDGYEAARAELGSPVKVQRI